MFDFVTRARAGDRPAFEHLYRALLSSVSRYVNAIVRNPDRAEDVIAETFLRAWRDLPKLRDIERFEAWLFRIAHNQAMTELSHHRMTASLDDASELADEGRFGRPERELNDALESAHLREAVARLPAAQREVLTLRYFEELPSGVVALRLGKNDQSVWALTYRALKRLRREIEASALAQECPASSGRAASRLSTLNVARRSGSAL